jgi:integrase/recombinase XerD
MLSTSVKRYISLRQTMGYRLVQLNRDLKAFAQFATKRGDTHIRACTVVAWASGASTPGSRDIRLRSVVQLALFLHAEDPTHEIPSAHLFSVSRPRVLPYIYSPGELGQIVSATGRLWRTYPLRRVTFATLFGLIAATGLRISEALDLRLSDLSDNGVLLIRNGKGGRSRLVPLHPTVIDALSDYLKRRLKLPVPDDHLFLSRRGKQICTGLANQTFRRVALLAGLVQTGMRPCRIHDMRHTFATRSLEQCPTRREDVAKHFVALATYLGHTEIRHTYWYLEATPELMTDIAKAADLLVGQEDA